MTTAFIHRTRRRLATSIFTLGGAICLTSTGIAGCDLLPPGNVGETAGSTGEEGIATAGGTGGSMPGSGATGSTPGDGDGDGDGAEGPSPGGSSTGGSDDGSAGSAGGGAGCEIQPPPPLSCAQARTAATLGSLKTVAHPAAVTETADLTDRADPVADEDDGSGFIDEPDDGGATVECSVFEQDCPADEKCVPYASDDAPAWNAARCVPVAPDPVSVGGDCRVEGSALSGLDDCAAGSMCFGVDAQTLQGTCVELCGCDGNTVCETPGTSCSVSNDGLAPLCLTVCNPLGNDCAAGEGCYPTGETYHCLPDASGDAGASGDPCTSINGCDPGLLCISGTALSGCDSEACCTPACDTESSDACGSDECVPLFEPGSTSDACLERVGTCI